MKHAITNFLATSHDYLGASVGREAEFLERLSQAWADQDFRNRSDADHSGYLERDHASKRKARAESKARRARRAVI